MNRVRLEKMTIDELVQRFVEIAHEQQTAELNGDLQKTRALYWKGDAVRNELRDRPGDQRHALVPLLRHESNQVMLKAALSTLALEARKARRVLEGISLSGRQPQALEAGMALWNLDRGVFKPTWRGGTLHFPDPGDAGRNGPIGSSRRPRGNGSYFARASSVR